MRRQIITTVILLIAVVIVTLLYFKNLNPVGQQGNKAINAIPRDAALVFEFKKDQAFYDIFHGNTLLTSLIGDKKTAELSLLDSVVSSKKALNTFFEGQSIFISIHPRKETGEPELLLTASANAGLTDYLDKLSRTKDQSIAVNTLSFNGKPGYSLHFIGLNPDIYLLAGTDNVFTAGFSQPLIQETAQYGDKKNETAFVKISGQQDLNSIANLYVNYTQLNPLFDQLFISQNTDLFRSFRLLDATGALSLNYKSDALMFNGITHSPNNALKSYIDLFKNQQPQVNRLKSVFPVTTAYSLNFAVSNAVKFEDDLDHWQGLSGIGNEKKYLLYKIKKETAVDLKDELTNSLANEFALVTTKYQEKIGIVQLKNGADLKPMLVNISTMATDETGQFNYDKIPFFLLGDPFSIFRRPFFMIADNYLIICNSQTGLAEYYRNYVNGNLLNKDEEYNSFNNLQAANSNVSFFIQFKNAGPVLKSNLKPAIASAFDVDGKGWNSYYGAAYQLTSSDNDFYTNFYMRLNQPDTTKQTVKPKPKRKINAHKK